MNDNDVTPPTGMLSHKDALHSPKSRSGIWIFLFLILLIADAAFVWLEPYLNLQKPTAPQDMAQIQQRLTGLENSVRALDERVNALSPAPAISSQTEVPQQNVKSAGDIARLQSDLVAMSSALTALQNEVKESGFHVQHVQQMAQNTLACAIAYIQLRATATTSQPFANELATMRDASSGDADFQKALGKIQPFASTGAATIAELQESLIALEASAEQAIDEGQAQNWWGKFVAELKTLVSIRKLHGGNTDAFGAMETDLAKNDLAAVSEDMKHLPRAAQNILNDWREKLEARRTVNDALHDLADHFTVLAKPPGAQ